MELNKNEDKRLIDAKNKVQRIKMFYLHLALYSIGVALILYNFYIMEEGPYTSNITAVNISSLVLWTVFICIHGWVAFKGRFIFKKSWDDKKIEKFIKDKEEEEVETTFWE